MKPLLFTLFFIASMTVIGQDIAFDNVFLKNRQIFSGEIIEIKKQEYVLIQTNEFGIIKVNYADISKITYKVNMDDSFFKKHGHDYISFALGTGLSYGGIGFRFQPRNGRKMGAAFFVGIGMNTINRDIYKSKKVLGVSLGAKFFPYKWYYISSGVIFNILESGSTSQSLFAMAGFDYAINNNFGVNAGIGLHSHDDYILGTGYFAIECGFFYKIEGLKKK